MITHIAPVSRIDSINHLIKTCKMKYNSWKCWYSPTNHGKALAVTVTYHMYLECAEGVINSEWKCKDPVDFHTFRDVLSKQMLLYDPKMQNYPDENKMRVVTQ